MMMTTTTTTTTTNLVLAQPFLTFVGLLLVESLVDCSLVLGSLVLKVDLVLVERLKVLSCLLSRAGTETLVVLDIPSDAVVVVALPILVLGNGIEGDLLLSLGALVREGGRVCV